MRVPSFAHDIRRLLPWLAAGCIVSEDPNEQRIKIFCGDTDPSLISSSQLAALALLLNVPAVAVEKEFYGEDTEVVLIANGVAFAPPPLSAAG